jgi:hypothetical protein
MNTRSARIFNAETAEFAEDLPCLRDPPGPAPRAVALHAEQRSQRGGWISPRFCFGAARGASAGFSRLVRENRRRAFHLRQGYGGQVGGQASAAPKQSGFPTDLKRLGIARKRVSESMIALNPWASPPNRPGPWPKSPKRSREKASPRDLGVYLPWLESTGRQSMGGLQSMGMLDHGECRALDSLKGQIRCAQVKFQNSPVVSWSVV